MKRRVVSVLAAMALGLSTLGIAAPAAAQEGAQYVALGDSVASGNGNLPYIDETNCLRSKRSYPMLLAKELGLDVVTEACSGAAYEEVAAQIQSGHLGDATELVTLTVGVNDVKWPANLDPKPDPDADWIDALGACSSLVNNFDVCRGALDLSAGVLAASLPQKIAALIGAIRTEAPNAQIVVTGYPLLFGDFTGTCSAGLFGDPRMGAAVPLSFAEAQAEAINQTIVFVNSLIKLGVALAADPDAIYVDVNTDASGNVLAGGFVGHGLCDTEESWISEMIPLPARTTDRGFHPNAPGQKAYAAIIAEAIEP